jgi:hypothetical protein
MEAKFLTKDLYLAALLCCMGNKFIGVNKSDRSYWFVFDNKTWCEKMIDEYWMGSLEVNAKQFVEQIRTLKAFIFSEQGKPNY